MLHILRYTPLGISLLSPTSSLSWETATIQPYLSTRHLGNIPPSWGIILHLTPIGLVASVASRHLVIFAWFPSSSYPPLSIAQRFLIQSASIEPPTPCSLPIPPRIVPARFNASHLSSAWLAYLAAFLHGIFSINPPAPQHKTSQATPVQ
ncbi:hypothetical protein ACN38_g523 [Penicillium nordicum]|uniref:Uncharacterized protein n=1 Tax=Penicillium nordicum TaxID=229535 RepID=A0A0M8PAL0_9EURO|nr:hypothetical protein ACN38_g523 [Penicillium nordicum]